MKEIWESCEWQSEHTPFLEKLDGRELELVTMIIDFTETLYKHKSSKKEVAE